MASPKSFVIFTLLSLKLGMIAALPVVYPVGNLQTFDSGDYELRWKYDSSLTEPKIYFKITAKTTGYVALAFPYKDALGNNKMDVVVAFLDAADNVYKLKDLHLTNSGTLAPDQSQFQDYTLESASFSQTTQETVVEFSRSKITSDTNDKQFVAKESLKVRWDYGQEKSLKAILKGLLSNLMQSHHQSPQQITFVPQ